MDDAPAILIGHSRRLNPIQKFVLIVNVCCQLATKEAFPNDLVMAREIMSRMPTVVRVSRSTVVIVRIIRGDLRRVVLRISNPASVSRRKRVTVSIRRQAGPVSLDIGLCWCRVMMVMMGVMSSMAITAATIRRVLRACLFRSEQQPQSR